MARFFRHPPARRDGLRYVTLRTIERAIDRIPRTKSTLDLVAIGHESGSRARCGDEGLQPWSDGERVLPPTLALVGADSGDTDHAVQVGLVRSLVDRGLRVAFVHLAEGFGALELEELRNAGAVVIKSLRDYGYSTVEGRTLVELHGLYDTILSDAESHDPDLIMIRLPPLALSPIPWTFLGRIAVSGSVCGVVLSARSAHEATQLCMTLGSMKLGIAAVVSPSSEEAAVSTRMKIASIPVHTADVGGDLVDAVMRYIRRQWLPISSPFLSNRLEPVKGPAFIYSRTG